MRARATRLIPKRNMLSPRAYRREEWKRLYRQSVLPWAKFNPYWELVTSTKEDAKVEEILVYGGSDEARRPSR